MKLFELLAAANAKIDIAKDAKDIPQLTGDDILMGVLSTAYSLAGIVAVIVIIVAGILYVTSDGDAAKVKRAKNAILYSVVGLTVIMLAFLITNFVAGRFA